MTEITEASSTAERANVPAMLRDAWDLLSTEDRLGSFRGLSSTQAQEFFLALDTRYQAELLLMLSEGEQHAWFSLLPLDDAADLVQSVELDKREALLRTADPYVAQEISALLAYAEDEAGGLMNPRFCRVRPDMNVDEALSYLHRQARGHVENMIYAYVLDKDQKLLGVVSLRVLFEAAKNLKVSDIMHKDVISVPETMDQEKVGDLLSRNDFLALPVVDADGRMKGVVTINDVVAVVREEATEDIQKLGATESLGAPYLEINPGLMVKKRATWLAALFIGEMFTATAMGYFEDEISKAVVLALFIPLIISSGGNTGSQATTLVIRAMALDEVRLMDWVRVLRRELGVGLCLGLILGAIGLVRILLWPTRATLYGPHYGLVALTVCASLVAIVMYGAIVGAMLPFILRKCKLDPASASAPFVATLVDVSGLIIYFTIAKLILQGTLL